VHTAEHIEAVERGYELHSQDELGAFTAPPASGRRTLEHPTVSTTRLMLTGSWACTSNRSCLVAAGGGPRVGQPGRACGHAHSSDTQLTWGNGGVGAHRGHLLQRGDGDGGQAGGGLHDRGVPRRAARRVQQRVQSDSTAGPPRHQHGRHGVLLLQQRRRSRQGGGSRGAGEARAHPGLVWGQPPHTHN